MNYVCADKHSWYVEFDEADEAQEALRYLREEVRDFCGKPICVGVSCFELVAPNVFVFYCALQTRIRAIPVSGSVNAFKSADKSSGGQRVGSVHGIFVPTSRLYYLYLKVFYYSSSTE